MPRATETARPDPDALLALAGRERRGKLTVFLGAAPGVGKTYAMLNRAQRLKADGADIVVGLVEDHGRAETRALLTGLEVLPRRSGAEPEAAYAEFDLDGALARRPAILLVDELAHSNVPGSRHPKRHQDVAELIGAGIDVWTALNIQHLESLADLVSRIAGVPVRETVPDTVLKQADEVVLVDLTPAELIERLEQGKIYLPDNARRAVDNFFKPATLTALRELALRRAADRVDDQVIDFLRQSAVEGPWATGERLLVCVGPDALSEKVVREASRLASGLNAHWIALSLNRPAASLADPASAARLEANLGLAERLGAEVRRGAADDFSAEIARVARREHVTQIVLGRPYRPWWQAPFHRSLPESVLRHAGDVGVHIVPGAAVPQRLRWVRRGRSSLEWVLTIAVPALSVGAISAIGIGLSELVALQNVSMLYLAAVVVSAIVGGSLSAVLAAGLSFLAYNFFFIQPTWTFTVARPYELFALIIFVGVALVTGTLAARLREHAAAARQQAQQTQALFDFSRKLSAAPGLDAVVNAIASHFQTTLGLGTVVFVPDENLQLVLQAAWPPDLDPDETALTAARWAFERKERAGFMTGTLPEVGFLFVPILIAQRVAGVVGLAMSGRGAPPSAEEGRTLAALLEQAGIALDRAQLAREAARAAVAREGEKLQAALLSSLSHDLRTPLASIRGAASSLHELGDRMDAKTRDDLVVTIEEESERLNRFVVNLFDMTRIESGSLKARRVAVAADEVIDRAVERARDIHPDLLVETSIADGLPALRGDPVLLEQVLFNLLDNARKYGGAEKPVSIFARPEGDTVAISVTDQGKGIPADDIERIFEKFYRRTKGDGRAAGTGLGLSIARGFVTAMGGTLKAESPAARRRGTRFVIRLPAMPKEQPS
jgi:two-component system, OmpR family, sensor histidine kinase KdpD